MTQRDGGRMTVDVAIVGSGFAGSLTALALRSMGRSVALLERGSHPRFAIGESTTPLANLLLEQLCDTYGLGTIRALSKWGTWQAAHPKIGGGLKRGFSFFHHQPGRAFSDNSDHRSQLLVAASPHDAIADTHWYRPDVDQFLAGEAARAGAAYLDHVDLRAMRQTAGEAVLDGEWRGRPICVSAKFVVDASGSRGFLQRVLGFGERPRSWLPGTQALFTHFEGVDRWERIMKSGETAVPPFPVDDAALHHVFPGGWIWVLRFENGITSAGAALTDPLASDIDIQTEGAWERLLARVPSVGEQFRCARAIRPFVHAKALAFRADRVVGPNWALLPSAAGFIDPLLSSGFPLTLLGITRLCRVFESTRWDGPEFAAGLSAYAGQTARELDATEQLVAALYASMGDFEQFKRLTLLYFAAASFSETVRRLGNEGAARGFLLCDDPTFGPDARACAAVALTSPSGQEREALLQRIDRAIAPFDVAGLGHRSRADWYPVLAEDLVAAAPKVGASTEQIQQLLALCGFLTSGTAAQLGVPATRHQRLS